ncbi:hypothetical protein [Arachidicoccus soli]|uniref:Uncharacterized protein n=1 Tax=Arachidicoccus soli TaxID=2341117 RepID=A0A386HQR7_9BACT|nr:hypothetical protein [Arachidicoccus soli]AYD48195.1 hypothetical protein D6B99_11665 [Arachidicoccus soli]
MQISNGQILLDSAMQACGDAGQAAQIALNNGLSLTDDLEELQEITTPNADIDKTQVLELMNVPANISASKDNTVIGEGLGFWGLGTTFKIE